MYICIKFSNKPYVINQVPEKVGLTFCVKFTTVFANLGWVLMEYWVTNVHVGSLFSGTLSTFSPSNTHFVLWVINLYIHMYFIPFALTITSGLNVNLQDLIYMWSTCTCTCLCRSLVSSLKAWRLKMLPCFPSLPVVPFWVFISFSRWVVVYLHEAKLKEHWEVERMANQDSMIHVGLCINFSQSKQMSCGGAVTSWLVLCLWIERSGFKPWPGHCVVFLVKTLDSHSA